MSAQSRFNRFGCLTTLMAAFTVAYGCGGRADSGHSNTNWIQCKTDGDCVPGHICVSQVCSPAQRAAEAGAGGRSAGSGGKGGNAGSSGAGGTDGGGINCWTGSFPVFDRGCTSAQSCVLVSHQSNRCGSSAMMAISQTEQARFDRAEATCEAQYLSMPTGCYSSQVTLDDGTTTGSASEAVADCVDSKCESRYKGTTFSCGSETCTAVQFCYQDPAGFTCLEDAGCVKSCAGCSSAYSACACNSVDGHTVIICGPP